MGNVNFVAFKAQVITENTSSYSNRLPLDVYAFKPLPIASHHRIPGSSSTCNAVCKSLIKLLLNLRDQPM